LPACVGRQAVGDHVVTRFGQLAAIET
jgi:hypothetical protein